MSFEFFPLVLLGQINLYTPAQLNPPPTPQPPQKKKPNKTNIQQIIYSSSELTCHFFFYQNHQYHIPVIFHHSKTMQFFI